MTDLEIVEKIEHKEKLQRYEDRKRKVERHHPKGTQNSQIFSRLCVRVGKNLKIWGKRAGIISKQFYCGTFRELRDPQSYVLLEHGNKSPASYHNLVLASHNITRHFALTQNQRVFTHANLSNLHPHPISYFNNPFSGTLLNSRLLYNVYH